MPSVFLSHSSKDKPFVRELAAFLEKDGDIKVWLDEREIAPGGNIVSGIAEGLDSDFILLILSPDSVDSNWVKEEWTDAFWDQTNNRKTKLLGVLYRDCNIPRLLRNKKYFDLRTNQPQGFREIRTFLLTQKPATPQRVNYLPVRPPLFIGRETELTGLRERLRQPGAVVHVQGLAGRGKTTLALEFAHRRQQDFEAVYWLPCQSSSVASIAAELARLLGLKLEGDLPEVVRELKGVCGSKRCLLILDNVQDEAPGELIPGGAASVLVTTRLGNLRFLRFHQPLPLPLFTEDECFELFRRQIGAWEVARHEAECRLLFARLGHLPIAVGISAALIREDVRYTVPGLARDLPEDVTALIREAIGALDAAPRQLLGAMAACAPEGFYLDLAAEVASLDEGGALEALQQLIARSLADEIDRTERRYRLHALVREAANRGASGQAHAEAVRRRFESWEANWRRCEQELPDLQLAFEWALKNASDSWMGDLAYYGYSLTSRVGRLTEAFQICEQMRRAAEERQDSAALQAWLGNQALIVQAWGRLEEALALHKRQAAICLELGNKDGLQTSYGNQALILRAWGRLEEALALHKKEEAICLELGNKDALQRSYGNQAVVLKAWGRLEEALALHKRQEAICLELGNKYSLQRSYGNQALIMKAWGRLEEALVLHKKEEAICLELGDKDGLQRSYGHQALVLRSMEQPKAAIALLKQQEALCLELGDRTGLASCYALQSSIWEDLGQPSSAAMTRGKRDALLQEIGSSDLAATGVRLDAAATHDALLSRSESGDLARPLNEAKLILVGRGGVGKTCIVQQLVNKVFAPQRETEGIQISDWTLVVGQGDTVRLHIWDFGGQEIMHAVHQFFLTDRTLYLVVLSGREGGEDFDVEYWLTLVGSFAPTSPVIVVLNKIQEHPFELNRKGLHEKYAQIRDFVRTDCEDGTGIAHLEDVIRQETDHLPNLRTKFSPSCSQSESGF
ncbi:MAG: TIR domain-containing protein [Bryobacteraceae bacterium]|jgi:small GTP-binding protein